MPHGRELAQRCEVLALRLLRKPDADLDAFCDELADAVRALEAAVYTIEEPTGEE
jgi:hypothetical protein